MPDDVCSVRFESLQVQPTPETQHGDVVFWFDLEGDAFLDQASNIVFPGANLTLGGATWTGSIFRPSGSTTPIALRIHLSVGTRRWEFVHAVPFGANTTLTLSNPEIQVVVHVSGVTTSTTPAPTGHFINIARSTRSNVLLLPTRVHAEVCPVVPVFRSRRNHRPSWTRSVPSFRREYAPEFGPRREINTIPNPVVIPRLTDPTRETAARLIITYHAPESLDPSRFQWEIDASSTGAASFLSSSQGRAVRLYGTRSGALNVHLRYAGQLVCTHRAIVAPEVVVPVRFNIVEEPHRTPLSWTRAQILGALRVANQILRQVHIRFVPDTDTSLGHLLPSTLVSSLASRGGGFFQAVAQAGANAFDLSVWDVRTPNIAFTSRLEQLCALNAQPNKFAMTFVRALVGPQWNKGTMGAFTNSVSASPASSVTDSGSPSNAWAEPSGIPGDTPTVAAPTSIVVQGGSGSNLLGTVVDTTQILDSVPLAPDSQHVSLEHVLGQTMAHEFCHALSLRHRGVAPEFDRLNHPVRENLMAIPADAIWLHRGYNIDLLQFLGMQQTALYSALVPP